MSVVYFICQQMMYFVIPLTIVALAGMFSERSGVMNIALDGTMIVGAFAGALFLNQTQGSFSGQGQFLCAMLIAAVAGMLFMALHAFASVNLNAAQTISGISMNMIAPALAIFLARVLFGVQRIPYNNTFLIRSVPLLGDIPVIGPMFFRNTYICTWIGIAIVVISHIVLYKTAFGLRLRSCGEHPEAASSVGIHVRGYRWCGVLISGFLAGMGGIVFIVPTSNMFSGSVAGYGFLAIAVLVFGQWKPTKIFLSAILFGLAKTISSGYSGIPFLAKLGISPYVYKIIPYAFTILMLILSSRNPQAPAASGQPYIKGDKG